MNCKFLVKVRRVSTQPHNIYHHYTEAFTANVTFALAIAIEMVVSKLAPQMKGVEPSSTGSEAQVVLSVTLETSQNTVFPAVQLAKLDELVHVTSR